MAEAEPESLNEQNVADIQCRLLTWYRANKRDLPWRGADAFSIWISEIMLQQTQVATVIPYYLRFLQRFPDMAALAAAPLDDVLHAWAGLGYYARARNLHRAAGEMMDRHDGRIPESRDDILRLPGIGAYTAGAILSIAYNQRFAAIDANVVRVICRLFGIAGDPKSIAALNRIRAMCERLVPTGNAGEFNQALMELGALVCDPADPNCEHCPLVPCCSAGNSPNPTDLPEYAAARTTTNLIHSCVVIQNSRRELLIVQRPPHGLWGGMWEFPRVLCNSGEASEDCAKRAGLEVGGLKLQCLVKLTTLKHTVTRFRIILHAYKAELSEDEDRFRKAYGSYTTDKTDRTDKTPDSQRWVQATELRDFAFSSPQTLVCKALLEQELLHGRL